MFHPSSVPNLPNAIPTVSAPERGQLPDDDVHAGDDAPELLGGQELAPLGAPAHIALPLAPDFRLAVDLALTSAVAAACICSDLARCLLAVSCTLSVSHMSRTSLALRMITVSSVILKGGRS
jgi:hypothetical protein